MASRIPLPLMIVALSVLAAAWAARLLGLRWGAMVLLVGMLGLFLAYNGNALRPDPRRSRR